jgi:hypothetical protein
MSATKWTLVGDEIRCNGEVFAIAVPGIRHGTSKRDRLRRALRRLNEAERDALYGNSDE